MRWAHFVLTDLAQEDRRGKAILAPGRLDFDIWKHDLTRLDLAGREYAPFARKILAPYNGYITDSVYVLLAQSTLPKEKNVQNGVARMAIIPKVIAVAKTTLRNPPKVTTETAIRQNRGAIAFYKTGFFDMAGEPGRGAEAHAAAAKVVDALEDYQKFLENDLLPRAKGEWRIGKEKFAHKLELELNAGLTA